MGRDNFFLAGAYHQEDVARLRAIIQSHLKEIQALELKLVLTNRLPVIKVCGDCFHRDVDNACLHPGAPSIDVEACFDYVAPEEAPPDWCPWRRR